MTRICSLPAVIIAAIVLLPLNESTAADIARGGNIAQRWCSQCHVVAPGQASGSDSVPTFAQISQSKHFNAARLSDFLTDPQHSRMPNLSLTRSEIADLTAYIKAQRH